MNLKVLWWRSVSHVRARQWNEPAHIPVENGSAAIWALLHPDVPAELLYAAVEQFQSYDPLPYSSAGRKLYASSGMLYALARHPRLVDEHEQSLISVAGLMEGIEPEIQCGNSLGSERPMAWSAEHKHSDLHIACMQSKFGACDVGTALDPSLSDKVKAAAVFSSDREWVARGGQALPLGFLLAVLSWLAPRWLEETHPTLVDMPDEWVEEALRAVGY